MTREAASGLPPEPHLSPALRALWLDASGDWESAHEACQQGEPLEGAWVHAYLHRKEGDLPNASYWYSRAHQCPSSAPFNDEWRAIASSLLERES